MNYKIIGSSSKGNCIIVENVLMLDCGVTYVRIKPYLKNVKVVFISHIHKDHMLPSTIKKIAYNKPTMKFICGSKEVVKRLYDNGIKKENIIFISNSSWYDLTLLKIKLDILEHDVENYALRFQIKEKKGIYIIDTANVDNIKAKDYDLYLIENNYQEEILNKHIQECEDDNQVVYLNRVKNTHLSKSQCDDFLINNMGTNSTFEYLHLSNYNNTGDGEIR